MSDDLRDRLAVAIWNADGTREGWNSSEVAESEREHYRHVADALLPIVLRYAATELRRVAEGHVSSAGFSAPLRVVKVGELYDRADELGGASDDYAKCETCGQVLVARPFERDEVMRRHVDQAHR